MLVKRAAVADDADKSDTAAAKRDPRARVLSLTVETQKQTDDLLCQQIYALYGKSNAAAEDRRRPWPQPAGRRSARRATTR